MNNCFISNHAVHFTSHLQSAPSKITCADRHSSVLQHMAQTLTESITFTCHKKWPRCIYALFLGLSSLKNKHTITTLAKEF